MSLRVSLLLIILTVELFVMSKVYAHSSTIVNSTTINNSKGIALAISMAQIDFAHTSNKWQGGAGFGFYNDITAISGGVAKKFNNTLIKGSIGIEEGRIGGGIGIIFQFN